jgi:hypothetical protein
MLGNCGAVLERFQGTGGSSASLTADFRFDLMEGVRTIPGGDRRELLAVRVAALYFIKTARRVARPGDYRSAGENIVHERARLGAVKQASAGFGLYTKSHAWDHGNFTEVPRLYI